MIYSIENFVAVVQKYCMKLFPDLDEIDLQLLELMQDDAARTLRELGEDVGLTPSAVQRRIARYRAGGVITRQVAVLDPHRVGSTLLASVMVTLVHESSEHHKAFTDRMLATPEVQQCYLIAGPWDYLVMLTAKSPRHCGELSDRLFNSDNNIQRYETSIVFETVKASMKVPVSPLARSRLRCPQLSTNSSKASTTASAVGGMRNSSVLVVVCSGHSQSESSPPSTVTVATRSRVAAS